MQKWEDTYRVHYKKRVLKEAADRFREEKVKRLFLSQWAEQYDKSRELANQEQVFTQIKENSLLQTAFEGMVKYTKDQIWKKSAIIAAN